MNKRKTKISHLDSAQVARLMTQFGFRSEEEIAKHAQLLLLLLADYAEPDGTIWIVTPDGKSFGISFKR